MGRRKKGVELSEVGKFESKNKLKEYNCVDNLIEDLKSKDKNTISLLSNNAGNELEEEKNKKKCEKLIVKTYKQKIQVDVEDLYVKLEEKFHNEEEVKNIISELKMKIKDLEYLFKKQWQVLKRFNLQEKIYREESKNLSESEKLKRDEVYKEAIEKLTAAHVIGFEPASLIKNKILSKIQQKFFITDEVMNELKLINFDSYFSKDAKENKTEFISEDKLLKKRYEDQVGVLEKFIRVNFLVPNNKLRDRDKEYDNIHNYQQNKQELKRYEKELELKAGKGGYYSYIIDEVNEKDVIQKFDNPLSASKKQSKTIIEREKASSIFEHPLSSSNSKPNFNNSDDAIMNRYESDNMNVDLDINSEMKMNTDDIFSNKYDKNIKVKDIFKICDGDNIAKFKDKVIEEMSEKANYNKEIYEDSIKNQNYPYKSKILNDLFLKLTYFNKLTDYEIQILIYLSHVIVRDLVQAKIFGRNYEGLINPEELLDFLKRFKIEIQNNGEVLMDGKTIGNQNMNQDQNFNNSNNSFFRGNQSSYSYLHSEYSKEEI